MMLLPMLQIISVEPTSHAPLYTRSDVLYPHKRGILTWG